MCKLKFLIRYYCTIKTPEYPPNLLHLQVGKIIQCQKHENAEKLYVSKVQIENEMGEHEMPKTVQVCSGLVNYIPLNQMINRKVVVLSNLKPSKMRGVKSEAMLLASEKKREENTENPKIEVDLINPPLSAKIGENLYFHPFISDKYPSKLKSKAWEDIQKHLKTNEKGEAVYVTDEGDQCSLKTKDDSSDVAKCDTLTNSIIR